MLRILNSVKGLFQYKKPNIDNVVFSLHHRITVIILVTFSLFVTTKQYIGDPIACMIGDIPKDVINTYCWIYGTYIVTNKLQGKIGHDMIQPGISNQYDGGKNEIKNYTYFHWICFVLMLQALLFYISYYIWKIWEGGRIKMLSTDLNIPITNINYRRERKFAVIDYLYENRHHHNIYLFRFIFCELLSLINIIAQIFFIDFFLDGEFRTYGFEVLKFTAMKPDNRFDPMARVFPKTSKCAFHKYGPSGNIERLDGLCLLPLNMINEKIYIFLWFWFLFLSGLSILAIIYRVQVLCIPKLRNVLLCMRIGFTSRETVNEVLEKCYIGDWFILYQLSKNIDSIIFQEILLELNKKLKFNDFIL